MVHFFYHCPTLWEHDLLINCGSNCRNLGPDGEGQRLGRLVTPNGRRCFYTQEVISHHRAFVLIGVVDNTTTHEQSEEEEDQNEESFDLFFIFIIVLVRSYFNQQYLGSFNYFTDILI